LQLDRLAEPVLFDERLRQADTARISDANQSRFDGHDGSFL